MIELRHGGRCPSCTAPPGSRADDTDSAEAKRPGYPSSDKVLFRFRNRDLDAATTEVEELRGLALDGLQHILTQAVVNKPPVAMRVDQMGVFENLQVVRGGDEFDFERLGDIADRHFALTQEVDNPQAQRLTQRLQQIGADVSLKRVVGFGFTHREAIPI